MENDFYEELSGALLNKLSGVSIEKVQLNEYYKVGLYLALKGSMIKRFPIKNIAKSCYRIFEIIKLMISSENRLLCNHYKYVLVIDQERKEYYKFIEQTINKLNSEDTLIISTRKNIYKYFNSAGFNVLNVNDNVSISFQNTYMLLKIIYKYRFDIKIKLHILRDLVFSSAYIRFYNSFLNPDIKSILTICDAHMHERLITISANKKGISTYTCQHGEIGTLWLPIVSNYFFIWGEAHFDKYKKEMGLSNTEVVLTGNPFKNFRLKEKINKYFQVTYIVTNYGEQENEKLFIMFLSLSRIDGIRLAVKLRPNYSEESRRYYQKFIDKYSDKSVYIYGDVTIESVIENSSFLVTFHSGVPIDAMAFGVASILLDIFENIQLDKLINYYSYSNVIHNENELIDFVSSYIKDKRKLDLLKTVTLENSKKFFYTKSLKESLNIITECIKYENNN